MPDRTPKVAYTRVQDFGEDTSYTPNDGAGAPQGGSYSGSRKLQIYMLVNILVWIASVGFLLVSIDKSHKTIKHGGNSPFRQLSFDPPLLDRFEVITLPKVVEGTLFNERNELLRAPPSPEVDAAWDKIAEVGIITISGSEVERLGKDPVRSTKAPVEWGLGTDAHLAEMDGQHTLHCLDALRRYAYRNYYYPETGNGNFSPIREAHLSHCLHILLQTLTCNYNFDLITFNWMATQKNPFPDFAVNKKCVDHNQILEWQAKNRVLTDLLEELPVRGPPEGQEILPVPPLLGEWSRSEDNKEHEH